MKFSPIVIAAFTALALEVTAAPIHRRIVDGDILGGAILSGNSLGKSSHPSRPSHPSPTHPIPSIPSIPFMALSDHG